MRTGFGMIVVLLLGLVSIAPLRAQETQPVPPTAATPSTAAPADQLTLAPNMRPRPLVQVAPDSVDQRLIDAASRPPGLLPYGPVSILDPMIEKFNAATDKYGLNIGFAA